MRKMTKTQFLLKNAKEALEAYRNQENELRKALADAIETTRKAKEKYEDLFGKNEQEVAKALREQYRHATK